MLEVGDGPGADAYDGLWHQAEVGIAPGTFEPALDEGAEPAAEADGVARDRQPGALVAIERCSDRRAAERQRGELEARPRRP